MASPFDFINAISNGREDPAETLDPREYNAFIVNRGLSLYPDTVLPAQEMNKRADLPPEIQLKFLHLTVTKKKRWSQWPKKVTEDAKLIEIISSTYKMSISKAEALLKSGVFSEQDKADLLDTTNLGGKKK